MTAAPPEVDATAIEPDTEPDLPFGDETATTPQTGKHAGEPAPEPAVAIVDTDWPVIEHVSVPRPPNPFLGKIKEMLDSGVLPSKAAMFECKPDELTRLKGQLQRAAGEAVTVQTKVEEIKDEEGAVVPDAIVVRFRLITKIRRTPAAAPTPPEAGPPAIVDATGGGQGD